MARKYRNFVYDENQRFIYPTSDWGFKYLLGSEENKDILLELLNRLFPDYHIESLEYLPLDHLYRGGGSRPLREFQNQGLEESLAEGLARGREEGREEGSKSKSLEIATALKKAGIDTTIISSSTGLSEKEILSL